MSFKPVFLATDLLIFLLLLGMGGFVWMVRRKEHLRAPWRRVAQSKSGVMSLTVLLFFVVVGLLDTLHFRPLVETKSAQEKNYSVEVLSVLDVIAEPLRKRVEKTYSAPFASHLYAKETVELAGGGQAREFPRLKYGGAHLADPESEWLGDVLRRGALGAAAGLLCWLMFAATLVLWVARQAHQTFSASLGRVLRGQTDVPWQVVLATLAVLSVLMGAAIFLLPYYHLLGTDKVGQDVLYLSLKSIRTGLVIGTLTTLVMLPFALLLGIMAGYFRGWVDDVIQYVYTTLSSIPGVLLIAASVLMAQVYMEKNADLFDTIAARADFRLLFLCIILGVTSWTGLCRLLRGETLKLREMEYIQAAHAFGVSHWRIISRHILPNVMHIVLITTVMEFSGLVLAEAVLSYVGVGVDPSMISFGTMINAARLEMAREPMVWWALLSAFGFMFVLVLCANLFADAVRDAFDPRVMMKARGT